MKAVLVLVFLLLPVGSLGSVGVLLDGPGWIIIDDDKAYNPFPYDVQKDGAPELIINPSWDVLQAVNKAGTALWTFTLDPAEVCPPCGTEPQYWSMDFYEFIDSEPGQRDAVIALYYNNWNSEFYWRSIGLVAAATGELRQQIVGRNFRGCMDLDDDGLWEIMLVVNDAGPGGYFEVWGAGSIAGLPANLGSAAGIQLSPNSPNPFNPSTRLQFRLQNAGPVKIEFYDNAGHLVDAVDLGHQPAGTHEYTWWGRSREGRPLPSGSYFFSVVSGGHRQSQKMLLLK